MDKPEEMDDYMEAVSSTHYRGSSFINSQKLQEYLQDLCKVKPAKSQDGAGR